MVTATASIADCFDPCHRGNPYPAYRALREAGRCHRLPLGASAVYLISGHADCVAALQSGAFGHVAPAASPFRSGAAASASGAAGGGGLRSMLRANPPAHTRLRRLVSKAFTARTTAQFRPATTTLADEFIDRALTAGGEVDLIEAFARPLPLHVICSLLGVPAEDEQLFGGWADALTRGLGPGPPAEPVRAAAPRECYPRLRRLLQRSDRAATCQADR